MSRQPLTREHPEAIIPDPTAARRVRWSGTGTTPPMILLVGIGQHRLVMLGHEASHWVLFKNRLLNEVAANWCCFFPMWGRSYNYRVQHFAHHQHVNDPEKDPVVIDMTVCGNKFRHPMPLVEFIWECLVKLPLWVPGLIRYAIARARYATLGERMGGEIHALSLKTHTRVEAGEA